MAINFPGTPALNETFTEGSTTWQYDGTTWNVTSSPAAAPNVFTRFNADTGFTIANIPTDSLTVTGGTNITTQISGDTITINSTAAGSGDTFKTITSDDGQVVASGEDTLNILGGVNIATAIATDSSDVTLNLTAFSIDFLSDVDTTSSTPTTGQVLKWNGTNWAPGADATTGGAGTDADTLDGFDSAYFLDYNNFSNTPSVLTLTGLSVGNELVASGDGAITYDNSTGVFRYTPPDLSSYLTDYTVTEADVTTHQAALSITESQISDLQSYITDYTVVATDLNSISIDALSDVDTTTAAPSTNDVLQWDGSNWVPNASAGGGDANQNAFSTVSVAGQSDIEADTTTDTITFAGASGITITTNAASDIITFTGPGTVVSAFSGLSDVITAQLTIDKLYLPAITRLDVTNNSASAYRFDQYGTSDNPTIYAINGTTIAFNLTAMQSSHPFLIQTSAGVNYSDGLTHVSSNGTCSVGSNAQGKDTGTLYWKIPSNISGSYRYQCSLHPAMVGTISIKNFASI